MNERIRIHTDKFGKNKVCRGRDGSVPDNRTWDEQRGGVYSFRWFNGDAQYCTTGGLMQTMGISGGHQPAVIWRK